MSLSHAQLFTTPWTNVAHQAPSSIGFPRQEYWSGLPFPSPGDLPDPGIKPRSPTLQADALTSEPPGKPYLSLEKCKSNMMKYHFTPNFKKKKGERDDPEIQFQSTCQKKKILKTQTCTQMFIASLVTMTGIIQMSISWWIGKQNVLNPWCKILFSHNQQLLHAATG